MVTKAAMVVGGGISGIQASIDLANMGFDVYLVEKSPSIGGRMAQLDKTFPTNDCSMCILAPKMIEAYRHPKIKLMTYSEVKGINGKAGDFTVSVLKKPRYVDMSKCTGCGVCQEKCPWKVKSEFNAGMGLRKAIYTPFPQAVPNVPVIDKELCMFFKKGTCKACVKFCEAGAINFDQQEATEDVKVGAVVVATGFGMYDLEKVPEYGYGRLKNVISAMEFERLTSAAGPTGGELKRASDGKTPHKLAFIQCVGSRDFRNVAYCSSVCCMHATKEAIMANEHHPETESTVFYMDMRAVGKRFQEYILRAEREYKVNYLRARPSRIEAAPTTENPIIHYEDTVHGQRRQMEFDLVILAQAMVPNGQAVSGVEQDEYGFVKVPDRLLHPVDSTRPGIFACGYCQSPRDIPDSVVQGSAAAARAAEILGGA